MANKQCFVVFVNKTENENVKCQNDNRKENTRFVNKFMF